jgi:hypothetical protein
LREKYEYKPESNDNFGHTVQNTMPAAKQIEEYSKDDGCEEINPTQFTSPIGDFLAASGIRPVEQSPSWQLKPLPPAPAQLFAFGKTDN